MRLILASFVVTGLVALIAVAIFIKPTQKPAVTSVTTYTQNRSVETAPTGFWKEIQVGDEENETVNAPAYFCQNSGKYSGHITDSKQGWWVAYNGKDILGSFATQEFAKKAVEDRTECK